MRLIRRLTRLAILAGVIYGARWLYRNSRRRVRARRTTTPAPDMSGPIGYQATLTAPAAESRAPVDDLMSASKAHL